MLLGQYGSRNKNSDLLLQLINDILDFSKIEASTFDIHPKKFDFKEICEEIYAVHTLKIPDHVRFSFLTSSLRTPKIFVKEFSYFLMPCHQHGLGVNLLVQR